MVTVLKYSRNQSTSHSILALMGGSNELGEYWKRKELQDLNTIGQESFLYLARLVGVS